MVQVALISLLVLFITFPTADAGGTCIKKEKPGLTLLCCVKTGSDKGVCCIRNHETKTTRCKSFQKKFQGSETEIEDTDDSFETGADAETRSKENEHIEVQGDGNRADVEALERYSEAVALRESSSETASFGSARAVGLGVACLAVAAIAGYALVRRLGVVAQAPMGLHLEDSSERSDSEAATGLVE